MKRQTSYRVFQVACVAFALSCLAPVNSAQAEFLDPILTVTVTAGSLSGSWSPDIVDPSDPLSWRLEEPVDIYSTNTTTPVYLGTIDSLDLGLDGDPQVLLNFSLTAGPLPAIFGFSTGVAFAPLANPTAFATAALTVTDNDSNGGLATGTFPGAKSYQAAYNGGTPFANLISPVVAPVDDSATGQERNPLVGSLVIPGVVTSITAAYSFNLTANDSASGTSRFSVVPEPSTVVLALMGSAAFLWCARRRK